MCHEGQLRVWEGAGKPRHIIMLMILVGRYYRISLIWSITILTHSQILHYRSIGLEKCYKCNTGSHFFFSKLKDVPQRNFKKAYVKYNFTVYRDWVKLTASLSLSVCFSLAAPVDHQSVVSSPRAATKDKLLEHHISRVSFQGMDNTDLSRQ